MQLKQRSYWRHLVAGMCAAVVFTHAVIRPRMETAQLVRGGRPSGQSCPREQYARLHPIELAEPDVVAVIPTRWMKSSLMQLSRTASAKTPL